MPNIISLGILSANVIILFVFTKIILNKFESRRIRYVLGTIFAYGILMCLLYLSRKCELIQTTFQSTNFRSFAGNFRDVGIIPVLIPALYSVFLVGYFEEDRDWKKVRAMMLSVSVNGIFAFISATVCSSFLKGDSLHSILKESAEYIDWRFIPPLIGLSVLFYFLMKWDYFKYHQK